jgi:hypothetical protein
MAFKQLPFYFYVYIFWGISPSRRTLECYAGGNFPQILYVPTFPWKYFFLTKWERSKEMRKESCLCKGRFQYSCILLWFGKTLQKLLPWGAPPPPPTPAALPQVSGPSPAFLAGNGGQPSTLSCDQILLVSSSSILHNSRHIVRVFFWEREEKRERKKNLKNSKDYSTAPPPY